METLIHIECEGPFRAELRGALEREVARVGRGAGPREVADDELVACDVASDVEGAIRNAGIDNHTLVDMPQDTPKSIADD